MADSTTNLDTIESAQAQKEVTANALFDAFSPAALGGRRASACVDLTWGYYGGYFDVAGTPTAVANGTLELAASDTSYISISAAGVISATVTAPTGWPGPMADGSVALYEVVTGASAVTSYTDYRQATKVGPQWAPTVNAQTGTSYTLQASDAGKVVTLSNAAAITLTVPSGLGANYFVSLIQLGAGQVTVTASGTTINSYNSLVKLAGQHAAASLFAYAANTFNLAGQLTA